MGVMVYSLFWVMQEFFHQPYFVRVRIRETLGDIDPLNKVPFKRATSRA